MSSIFEKFNRAVDLEGLRKDVQEAGQSDYDEVPVGTYEVKIEKMELKESSKGDPMVSIWFKILSGDQKGRLLFMNQVITQGFQIGRLNSFLKALDTEVTVEFKDYVQYNDLLMDILEAIDQDGLEYLIDYSKTSKGFSNFKIEEVYGG